MRPNMTALKQLRRVVEATPDDLLHMRYWKEESSCGTARCAAGWAAVDPWFIAHGLSLYRDAGSSPYFENRLGSNALQRFFRLSYKQTKHLFATVLPDGMLRDPHSVSKRQVLNQIDRLLRGEPTRPYRRSRARRP